MKRIFLAIGMAALMLISGTNVYMANQTNKIETNLNLENIEAEGSHLLGPFAEFVVGGLVSWGVAKLCDWATSSSSSSSSNYYNYDLGHLFTTEYDERTINGRVKWEKDEDCYSYSPTDGCIVGQTHYHTEGYK